MNEIHANELRIGNLVTYKGKVVDVGIHTFHDLMLGLSDAWEYAPIPLSEEWLLKFGFELYDDNGELKAGDRFYTHPSFPGCLTTTFIYNWTDHRVQYVHQLQNIYFCLVGKELTLTPETK